MITQSWFDRPLGAAGRIVCDVDGILDSILVNISEPSFIIPSLAIHMTRGMMLQRRVYLCRKKCSRLQQTKVYMN